MKKLSWLFLTLGLGCSSIPRANAQLDSLRNGDFESWVNRSKNGTTYSDPEFWYTLNSLTAFGMEPTTWASNNPKSGTKAVYLETTSQTFGVIPGILACNNFLDAMGTPDMDLNKIPFQSRPAAISFWHKSNPASGDSSAFNFTLSKFKNNAHQIIAKAAWTKGNSDSTYQYVKVFFEYYSDENPDSASIIFSSSINGFDPVIGSSLLLDEVRLEYISSGIEKYETPKIELYPNPSNDHKVYFNSNNNFETYTVKDLQGKEVKNGKLFSNEINLEELKTGIYILQLTNSNNQSYTHKIILN